MAMARIESIINIQAIQAERDQLIAAVNDIAKSMQQITGQLKVMGVDTSMKGLKQQTDELERSTAELAAKEAALNKTKKRLSETDAKLKEGARKVAEEKARERYETTLLNLKAKEAAILASSEASAYDKLKVKLAQATREVRELTLTRGKNSKATLEAVTRQQQLDTQIKKLDVTTGQHQRNVGNYSSSFKGLGRQMLSVIGLTGGITAVIAGLRRGYMDYEEKIKQERSLLNALEGRVNIQRSLIAQGEVLQRLTGVDDADINNVQKLAAVHGLTESQIKKVTKASLDWAAVTGQDVNTAAVQLLGTFEGSLGRLGRWDKDFKHLSATEMENGGVIDVIAQKYNGFAGAAVTASAKARVSFREAMEELGRIISPVVIRGMQTLTGLMSVFQTGKTKTSQRLADYKAEVESMDTIAIYQRKINAEKMYASVVTRTNSKSEREWLAILKNNISVMDDVLMKRKETRNEKVNFIKETKDEAATLEKNVGAYEKLDVQISSYEILLKNAAAAGNDNVRALNAELSALRKKKELIDLLLKHPEKLESRMPGQVTTPGVPSETELKPEQVFPLPDDKLSQEWENFYDELKDLAIETLGKGISDQITASFENSIAAMNDQLEAWHDKRLKEIDERHDKGITTDAQYLKEKEKLEADYQRKQKELKIKEARIRKSEALWQVAINTAVQLTQTGGPLDPKFWLVLANGAAQATVIAAQPLPKYARGRKGGKGELAVVGEAGAEAIMVGGKAYMTPDKPTVTYLPLGADVIPNAETMRMITATGTLRGMDELRDTFEREITELRRAIVNKRETHLNITERGIHTIVRNGNAWQEHLNGRVRI